MLLFNVYLFVNLITNVFSSAQNGSSLFWIFELENSDILLIRLENDCILLIICSGFRSSWPFIQQLFVFCCTFMYFHGIFFE